MPKTLRQLLDQIPAEQIISIHGDLDVAIEAGVVESSHDVQQGGLFVAREGQKTDGHRYIPAAIAAGAAAIVGVDERLALSVPYVRVKNAQAALGRLAAAYHDFPSRKMLIIGVTGTDGKTTTCHLLHSIFQRADLKSGYISTISADFGTERAPTGLHVTTPGAPQIQAYLSRMLQAGLTHCILEMTSHGLAQGRLAAVDIDVAVLTNVMHEHLDFHGTWENYRAAKATMFRMLNQSWHKSQINKLSVINADDPSAEYFAAIPAENVRCYSLQNHADYRATAIQHRPAATDFQVQQQQLTMQLLGDIQYLQRPRRYLRRP